jgi:hypothetical protein
MKTSKETSIEIIRWSLMAFIVALIGYNLLN